MTVKTFLENIGAPFYDYERQMPVNGTPVLEITNQVSEYSQKGGIAHKTRFFLKEEYRNPLTNSVKGRAVASMVLNGIRRGEIYKPTGEKKMWIEPTSGNTGKGLAEIAELLDVEFIAVFSRLDVSEDIKRVLVRFGAKMITIGSEYSLQDLEGLAKKNGKTVCYYWAMPGEISKESESIFAKSLERVREIEGTSSRDGQHSQEPTVKNINPDFFVQNVLTPAAEALRSPLVARIQKGEFSELKREAAHEIPELNDSSYVVGFLCPQGNTSMAVNTLFSQLGFENVCSINGGVDELKNSLGKDGSAGTLGSGESTTEFCPLPGSSISSSSIDFVNRLVSENPEEYFTFMQYENVENVNAHLLTTGPEIERQIPDLGAVVCTFGTGGTATGLASYFAKTGVKVYTAFPVRPVEGIRTLRGAEGLEFFKPEEYGGIIEVDNAAVDRALRYFVESGLNVGPSTAVAIEAARSLREAMGERSSIAIIAADGIENYKTEYSALLRARN